MRTIKSIIAVSVLALALGATQVSVVRAQSPIPPEVLALIPIAAGFGLLIALKASDDSDRGRPVSPS